ncbi:MAG: hypothetical protein AAGI30_08450 [Planctomycetota bacterium]
MVELVGDALEACPAEAHDEGVLHRIHPGWIAEHETSGEFLPGLAQRLTLRVCGAECAVAIEDGPLAPFEKPHAVEHVSVGPDDLAVVPVGRHAARVALAHHR